MPGVGLRYSGLVQKMFGAETVRLQQGHGYSFMWRLEKFRV